MKRIVLSEKQRGLITVFGGFTVHLVMGAVFMWGTLNVYITSYFRQLNDEGLSLSIGGAIFPVMMACVATGMPIGIKAISMVSSPRLYCICASIISCLLIFLSSYATYFWQYVLIYGVGFGLVSGTLYFIPIYMGYLYFPKHRGFVSGTILAGYGLCSLVFGLWFFAIVNPEGLTQVSDEDGYSYFQGKSISVAQNVPSTIRQLSWVYLIVSVFGSCFILKHPSQEKESQKVEAQSKTESTTEENQLEETNKVQKEDPLQLEKKYQMLGAPTPKIALSQPQFYVSLLLAILAIGFGVIVNGNYKSIAKDFGFSTESYQSLVGALVSTANGISRPFWSNLVDRFTFKQILTTILLIQITLSLTLQLSKGYEVFFAIWVFIINTTFGGVLAIWPVFSAQLNGTQIGSKIYGFYWYAFSIANMIQFLIVYFLKPKIGFTNIFYIYSVIAALGLTLLHSYSFTVNWSKYYQSPSSSLTCKIEISPNLETEKEELKGINQNNNGALSDKTLPQ